MAKVHNYSMQELYSIKMVESSRGSFMRMIKLDMDANSTVMVTYTLVTSHKIRNMGKDHSTGLVYALLLAQNKQILRYSSTMVTGGEDFPMEKANIKKQMVNYMII